MDSIKKPSHQVLGGSMDNVATNALHHHSNDEEHGMGGKEQNLTISSSSLSDSGCPQSPDDADLMFSPPTLSRCATDSPSHYFLRGTQHRWSSTPLLKIPGFQRSISMIPVSSTPCVLPATIIFSPPKASSTPETNNENKGKGLDSGLASPFTPGYSSLDSPAISSLSSIQHPSYSNQKISSLAQLSSQEFKHRLHACEDIELDNIDTTLPFNGSSFDLHISKQQILTESNNHSYEDNNSVKLVNNASNESDSGFGSSHHETSAEESPKRNKVKASTVVATKLRRSPRSLAIQNRVDRISRGTSSTKLVTSPKGKLKTTSFRKTPGFYSEWDRLDMLGCLSRLNMLHVVDTILNYLGPEDLCRVSLVNSSWHKLLQQPLFGVHEARRASYVTFVKLNRENYGRVVPMTRSSSRIALKEMNRISPQNKRNRESSNSAPNVISPSKIRSRLFTEDTPVVGEIPLLEKSVRYLHCPHCSATSKVKSCQDKTNCAYEVAECSSKSCGFIFCVKCLYMDHSGKSCQIPQLTRSRSAVVTSKKSKARLRRL